MLSFPLFIDYRWCSILFADLIRKNIEIPLFVTKEKRENKLQETYKMDKWSFANLQKTCSDAKKKGLLPESFACRTTKEESVTKKKLYAALLEASILTNTGELMEQISRKLEVYVIVHTTVGAGLSQSPFEMEEFESPATGLQGAHNLLGTFTSLEEAYRALSLFIENKKKRDKKMLSVRLKIATLTQLETQFSKGALSYIAADASWKGQTDYFVIHKSVLDREHHDVDDIRTRFTRYGKSKTLDIKSSTYKGTKTLNLAETIVDSLRKEYKKVPRPDFTIMYNPNSDVWYFVVTGTYLGEQEKTTANHIYSILDQVSDVIDFADLGVSPVVVETTQYSDTKTHEEIQADLERIAENVFLIM